MEYDCFFLGCVRPERSTRSYENGSTPLCLLIMDLRGEAGTLILYMELQPSKTLESKNYESPLVEIVSVCVFRHILQMSNENTKEEDLF